MGDIMPQILKRYAKWLVYNAICIDHRMNIDVMYCQV